MLGNISTDSDKYSLQDCENLLTPVQMQLSSKLKRFSDFFVSILETTLKFEDFETKDDCYIYFISEKTDCPRLGFTTV